MSSTSILRQRSLRKLEAAGLSGKQLPELGDAVAVKKTAMAIGQRIVILFAVGGLANGGDATELYDWLVGEMKCADALTAAEKTLFTRQLTEEEENEASWAKEGLGQLLWSVGRREQEITLVGQQSWDDIFPLIPPQVNPSDFFGSLRMREGHELIEALDLLYVTSATLRDVREDRVCGVFPAAIQARREAMEWLFSDEEWGMQSLDT